jgi:ubiquitin C-terminal hydrolase
MPPKTKLSVCPHLKPINSAKFSNCLNNFSSAKCAFKHPKHSDPVPYALLAVSTSKYEIGCGDDTELTCLKQLYQSSKKDAVVVYPVSGVVWCYECETDLNEYYEALEDKDAKPVAAFVKSMEEIIQKLHSSKVKVKMQTNSQLMEQVRPGLYKELHSSKAPKKEEVICPKEIFGIENIGNTCFFNSVIQALNANRPMVDHYIQHLESYTNMDAAAKKKTYMINQRFAEFLNQANQQDCAVANPKQLFTCMAQINPVYGKYYQQDASEAYRYLIDALVDGEVSLLGEPPVSPKVAEDYGGTSASQVFCLHCDYRSMVFSPFFDIQLSLAPHDLSIAKLDQASASDDLTLLSKDPHADSKQEANANFSTLVQDMEGKTTAKSHVPLSQINYEMSDTCQSIITSPLFIPNPVSSKHPKTDSSKHEKHEGSIHLEDVVYNNFREDFLNNIDNFYICSKCDKKEKITAKDMRFIVRKSFFLESPEVLVLTFKRFKKTSDSLFSNYTKNSAKVVYGDALDLTPYFIKKNVDDTYTYELEAVVCHNGNLQNGHYTAYAKHKLVDENCWIYFSDQYWKKVEAKDALSNPSAFMLFYRRKK